jgi:glucose/arabinose dehydrogenase
MMWADISALLVTVGVTMTWLPAFVGSVDFLVLFSGRRPNGKTEDVVTGSHNSDGEARGRPVAVAVDTTGALQIADDVENTVWRVASAGL